MRPERLRGCRVRGRLALKQAAAAWTPVSSQRTLPPFKFNCAQFNWWRLTDVACGCIKYSAQLIIKIINRENLPRKGTHMRKFVAGLAVAAALMSGSAAYAQSEKPTVVLVHGAFADGSSWNGVVKILEKDGY